jgi:hypothetical protein
MNPAFLPGPIALQKGPLSARSPSTVVLILSNLVPVVGVFLADWDVGAIMAIYWLENVAIGLLNAVKMLLSRSDGAPMVAKLGATAFFCVHYGIFTLVHGIFVFAVFQKDGPLAHGGGGSPFASIGAAVSHYGLAFLALFCSHLFSLFVNFIGRGEYKEKNFMVIMFQPYGRIVILHVTIILGAFVTLFLGSPKPVILLLVFLKTFGDVFFHLMEHNKGGGGILGRTKA